VGFSGFSAGLRHHLLLNLRFLLFFLVFYPWASAELLAKTSTFNSSEDVRKHREGEPSCKWRVFRRESDA